MGGTDYVRSKEGIARIHEAMYSLMLDQFLQDTENDINIDEITDLIINNFSSWNTKVENYATLVMPEFKKYTEIDVMEASTFCTGTSLFSISIRLVVI